MNDQLRRAVDQLKKALAQPHQKVILDGIALTLIALAEATFTEVTE